MRTQATDYYTRKAQRRAESAVIAGACLAGMLVIFLIVVGMAVFLA